MYAMYVYDVGMYVMYVCRLRAYVMCARYVGYECTCVMLCNSVMIRIYVMLCMRVCCLMCVSSNGHLEKLFKTVLALLQPPNKARRVGLVS